MSDKKKKPEAFEQDFDAVAEIDPRSLEPGAGDDAALEAGDPDAPGPEAAEHDEADEAFAPPPYERPMAYIRPVAKSDLQGELPPHAPDGPYFALHDGEGRPLALFTDHTAAVMAAKAHHYSPVSVH